MSDWPPMPQWYGFGFGLSYVTTTVFASFAVTDVTPVVAPFVDVAAVLSLVRLNVNATSSALNGVPSDHLTPVRSFHVTVFESAETPPLAGVGISNARPFARGLPS